MKHLKKNTNNLPSFKRNFDVLFSFIGIILSWWLIIIAWILATIDTQSNGFFTQNRVGKSGKIFKVIKIKTMRPARDVTTTVTNANDIRITSLGSFFRKTKIDELPQLWNVLIGDMSFVGPRPDVPGFADQLSDDDRIILSIRPGITGPATLHYRNEEELLAQQDDPEKYNQEVIFPHKVQLNKQYIKEYSLLNDIKYIWQTINILHSLAKF